MGTADQILGGLDAQKLHSSMTLFQQAEPGQPLFQKVLDRYFGGVPDPGTTQLLQAAGRQSITAQDLAAKRAEPHL